MNRKLIIGNKFETDLVLEPMLPQAELIAGNTDPHVYSRLASGKPAVVINCSTNEELLAAIVDHSQRHGIPLLNLTGKVDLEALPNTLNFLLVECPLITPDVLDYIERVRMACQKADEAGPFRLQQRETQARGVQERSSLAEALNDYAAKFANSENSEGLYHRTAESERPFEPKIASSHVAQIISSSGDVLDPMEMTLDTALDFSGRLQDIAEGMTLASTSNQGVCGRFSSEFFRRQLPFIDETYGLQS